MAKCPVGMKMVSKKSFQVPRYRLWEIIREPGNQPAWNPKCVECEDIGQCVVGAKFAVTYEMKGIRQKATGEVLDIQAEHKLTYRYHYEDDKIMGSVDEHFELIEAGMDKTTLVHTVDFQNSSLPRWVKWLIGLMSRFGRTVGPDPLDGLDDLLK